METAGLTTRRQNYHAGALDKIIIQADKASAAQQPGRNPERTLAAAQTFSATTMVDGLRLLLREKLKLNKADGPADGWLTQDALG